MESVFTVGCDPEFFLYDEELGNYVSSIPFIKGTKHEPEKLGSGGYIMRDNVAVEFGMPPASTLEEWLDFVNMSMRDVENYIPDFLSLRIVPSAEFPRQQLHHPEAAEIGCEPDFNAWTNTQNIPPVGFANSTFRSCGGHVHVGYVEGSGNDFLLVPEGKLDTIKAMDCLLGIVSVVLDNSPEAIARRDIYGKAGCYRPTDYGVEYRTLSNFWCKSDALKKLMYRLTSDSLWNVRDGQLEHLIKGVGGGDVIQQTINEGDQVYVSEIMPSLEYYMSPETIKNIVEVLHD